MCLFAVKVFPHPHSLLSEVESVKCSRLFCQEMAYVIRTRSLMLFGLYSNLECIDISQGLFRAAEMGQLGVFVLPVEGVGATGILWHCLMLPKQNS